MRLKKFQQVSLKKIQENQSKVWQTLVESFENIFNQVFPSANIVNDKKFH